MRQSKASKRKRIRAWYARARLELILALGGKCELCPRKGRGKHKRGLEFDHIHGRTWPMQTKSRWARLAIIKREALAGEIRVLCRSCNGALNKRRSLRDTIRAALEIDPGPTVN